MAPPSDLPAIDSAPINSAPIDTAASDLPPVDSPHGNAAPVDHPALSGGLPPAFPPKIPPRVGTPSAASPTASRVQVLAEPRLSSAGRALLALLVMAVLTAVVVLMLGRAGALPDGGVLPGDIGQNLDRVQHSFGP